MMETVFNLIYVLCDLLAIGFGAKALLWLLSGELRHKSAVLFLRSVLAASIIGLFFPSHHLPSSHGISNAGVVDIGGTRRRAQSLWLCCDPVPQRPCRHRASPPYLISVHSAGSSTVQFYFGAHTVHRHSVLHGVGGASR